MVARNKKERHMKNAIVFAALVFFGCGKHEFATSFGGYPVGDAGDETIVATGGGTPSSGRAP